jgi:hypothetical protein
LYFVSINFGCLTVSAFGLIEEHFPCAASEVDAMTGKSLKNFTAVHFEKLGYSVSLTQEIVQRLGVKFCKGMARKRWFKKQKQKIQLGLKAVQVAENDSDITAEIKGNHQQQIYRKCLQTCPNLMI